MSCGTSQSRKHTRCRVRFPHREQCCVAAGDAPFVGNERPGGVTAGAGVVCTDRRALLIVLFGRDRARSGLLMRHTLLTLAVGTLSLSVCLCSPFCGLVPTTRWGKLACTPRRCTFIGAGDRTGARQTTSQNTAAFSASSEYSHLDGARSYLGWSGKGGVWQATARIAPVPTVRQQNQRLSPPQTAHSMALLLAPCSFDDSNQTVR